VSESQGFSEQSSPKVVCLHAGESVPDLSARESARIEIQLKMRAVALEF
jgi:hypothetical protein